MWMQLRKPSHLPFSSHLGCYHQTCCCTISPTGRNFQETAPRTPLFAPLLCRGFGWKHGFYLQGLAHVSTCIQESAVDRQTGSPLQQSYKALIMEVGIPVELRASNLKRHLTHISPMWLLSTWQCASAHEINMLLMPPRLLLLCNNNTHLMDLFSSVWSPINVSCSPQPDWTLPARDLSV